MRFRSRSLATLDRSWTLDFAQMEESLSYKRHHDQEALERFLKSHRGMVTMDSLRLALEGMAREEKTTYARRLQVFTDSQDGGPQRVFVAGRAQSLSGYSASSGSDGEFLAASNCKTTTLGSRPPIASPFIASCRNP